MKKDRDWFISEYKEIHTNLNNIESEINSHLENGTGETKMLDELKKKTDSEIQRLQKTRKDEMEFFDYKNTRKNETGH